MLEHYCADDIVTAEGEWPGNEGRLHLAHPGACAMHIKSSFALSLRRCTHACSASVLLLTCKGCWMLGARPMLSDGPSRLASSSLSMVRAHAPCSSRGLSLHSMCASLYAQGCRSARLANPSLGPTAWPSGLSGHEHSCTDNKVAAQCGERASCEQIASAAVSHETAACKLHATCLG